ncbi:hypothetical protein C1645_857815 [Glomus cerebriforme]|uniref:Uncharacterized protein n=1 Tax=Glomus cerebriforme TaxID=658196 RepID=A0A397SN05_9GLOM|nr:hypothetical protein C1645_857815 [Glomus cerebriforme]
MSFSSQKCPLIFTRLQIKMIQSPSASASLGNELQDSIYDIKDAIIDDEQTVNEFEEANTKKAGKVNSLNYSEKAKMLNVSFDEYVELPINIQDEKLQREPIVKSIIIDHGYLLAVSYRIFTNQEWAEIIKTNPYTIENPSLLQEISVSLHEASCENFIGKKVFMNGENNIK